MKRFGFARLALYLLSFAVLPRWYYALLFCLVVELVYPYIVAKIYNVEVMPAMDYMTTMSARHSPANILSVCYVEGTPDTDWRQKAINHFWPIGDVHPKLRTSIVKIGGDLYYKPLDKEIAFEKMFTMLPPG